MLRWGRHHTGWREFSFSLRSPLHARTTRILASKGTTIMEFPRAFNEEPFDRPAHSEAGAETDAVADAGFGRHNVFSERPSPHWGMTACPQRNLPTLKSPRCCPRLRAGMWSMA